MAWWVILDKVLDVVDKATTKMEKDNAKRDKKGEEKKFLPFVDLGLAKIFFGITAIIVELLGAIKLFKSGDLFGELPEGTGDSQYSGQAIMDTAIGHKAVVTSGYGAPREYRHGTHEGVDIKSKKGDPVYAPFDGTVVKVNNTTSGNGGRSVTIVSEDKQTQVFMCHFSSISVATGQKVKKGQQIANVGGSGLGKEDKWSPHLHLEVMILKNGKYVHVDPENLQASESSSTVSQGALSIEGVPSSLQGSRAAANGSGKLMKNPGNSTDKKNPWQNGKTHYNGHIHVVGYNNWIDGYAGCAYHLLKMMDGTIGKNRNPTFKWLVGMWVNGKDNASSTQVSKRAKTGGITDVNKRIKITKNNVLVILMAISIWDSGYNNASEAKQGVDKAWRYWLSKGGKPDTSGSSGNILNSRAQSSSSSATVVDNSSNRRQ